MKILAALLGVLVAVPAFATDPQFGAIRIEATQNVIHAFVSGMPQGGDATKVSKDEWNAAHTVPAILIASVPTGIVWPIQPAALTEFCGVTTYRWRANLANTSTIRLTTQVIAAGAATSALRLQYTTDTTGASGWAYLDSASGPSVAVDAIAIAVSSSVSVATAAKADVLLRLVGINGDGAGGQACHSSILASNATSATSAATAIALAANGTNCSAGQFPLGVNASGAVETCTALPTTITGTANQIAASGSTGAITLSIPSSPTLPGTTTGTFSGNVTGNVTGSSGSTTGNAGTATALAANGANCSADQFPLGVDASGVVETCTALPTTITGTANQIAASGSTGAITLSIPSPTLQLGVDVNGSPVAQTLKAHDGITGTDIAASSLTLGSQIGTGTGVNQNNINRALTKATGTTAQTTANAFTVCASKILSNTSATATTFATIALASNSGGGASVELSLTATDGTNFDSETQSANLAFVNKATVMTVSTPTVTASSSANNSGSATIGFTATGTSPTISLKVTPVFTTIVPTTVTLYAIVKSHGAGAVTCQ